MDADVERWIAQLIVNGTFYNREDILEFCVYATKIYCEHGDEPITQKTLIRDFERPIKDDLKKIPMEYKRQILAMMKNPFPMKLKDWKAFLNLNGGDVPIPKSKSPKLKFSKDGKILHTFAFMEKVGSAIIALDAEDKKAALKYLRRIVKFLDNWEPCPPKV